jgi:hypothetical protein
VSESHRTHHSKLVHLLTPIILSRSSRMSVIQRVLRE